MPIALWLVLLLLLVVFVLAVSGAGLVLVTARDRQQLLHRAVLGAAAVSGPTAADQPHRAVAALRQAIERVAPQLPELLRPTERWSARLRLAGFPSSTAWVWFLLARVVSFGGCIMVALAVAPRANTLLFVVMLLLGGLLGLSIPVAVVERLIAQRQQRIRHALPDTLDLLVICLEAGIAMDGAIPRVARELMMRHPDLSLELLTMSRQLAAGSARDQAWYGLHARTGVDDLRGLVTHLLQSERWGTSVATVLRVYAKNLRRRRKSAAEKRAATASTRMLVPLALCIFPTIFVVILGPAVLQIISAFRGMAR